MGKITPAGANPSIPTNPPIPGASPVEGLPQRRERIGDYQKRIRLAIGVIVEACPGQTRSLIDSYFRFIGTSKVFMDGSQFPRTVRRHPLNAGRCTENVKAYVLAFHIGNTLLALYDAVTVIDTDAFDGAATFLGNGVRHLEQLARTGFDNMILEGEEAKGWRLAPSKAHSGQKEPPKYIPEVPDPKEPKVEDNRDASGM